MRWECLEVHGTSLLRSFITAHAQYRNSRESFEGENVCIMLNQIVCMYVYNYTGTRSELASLAHSFIAVLLLSMCG